MANNFRSARQENKRASAYAGTMMDLTVSKKCAICSNNYVARVADLRRGWGRTCSKSCATKLSNRKKRKANAQKENTT